MPNLRLALAAVATFLVAMPSTAQISIVRGQARLDSLEAMYRADFAIPDAPALDLVDENPSDLLRPSSVREFALAASQFSTPGGSFRLPEAFALEIAPFLLASGRRLSIGEYRAHPALYRFRISGATGRDSLQRSALALGLRATLLDEGDLRTRNDYIEGVTDLTTRINNLVVDERLARAAQGEAPNPQVPLTLSDLTGDRQMRLDALLASVDSLRRAMEDRTWNARALDVALATRARAADSLGHDLHMTDYVAWVTYGDGFGQWGQLLLGARVTLERDYADRHFRTSGSLTTRLYVGSNRYKAFTEGQISTREGEDQVGFFLNAGGEARLFRAVWTTFSAGLEWTEAEDRAPGLAGRFAVKLALPDLAESGLW